MKDYILLLYVGNCIKRKLPPPLLEDLGAFIANVVVYNEYCEKNKYNVKNRFRLSIYDLS